MNAALRRAAKKEERAASRTRNGVSSRVSAPAAVGPQSELERLRRRQEQQRQRLLASSGAQESPRLRPVNSGNEARGAPLLAEPAEKPEDRFCSHMPQNDVMGGRGQRSGLISTNLSFEDSVSRLDTTVSQASIMLNDRLKALQTRCRNASVPEQQVVEFCEIADGIAAASYHVQKWAYCYKTASQLVAPAKPTPCDDFDEACSSLRFATPRLMVGAGEVRAALTSAIKTHGASAQEHSAKVGVPLEDLRALPGHLEHWLARLGRFCNSVKPRTWSDFVVEYFTPAIRTTPARLIVAFAGH
eukprot:TRINITY_DN42823_c0_g2_i1.p1 TRINITY_DN42823_c0_g2~~TRINITY_DN42823_c0_g2_i1.p1  ORF type:complete len:301 (+),score=49.06 TRINITY_DN42823_c0_g2_i1:204-1106(+)